MADSKTEKDIDLVINSLSRKKYESLLSADLVNDDEIYLVEDEFINAKGQRIHNVADPSLSSDAANKDYVDTALQQIDMKPLSGQTYDLAIAGKFTDLVIAVAEALGAEVTNKPA